jgi:hypothetical protein
LIRQKKGIADMLMDMRSTAFCFGFITLICTPFFMLGCGQDSYTTWSCKSPEDIKFPMVLRKAQMQFQEKNLNYCGSLGEKSYFDASCSADIQNNYIVFAPASGVLRMNNQEYRCDTL